MTLSTVTSQRLIPAMGILVAALALAVCLLLPYTGMEPWMAILSSGFLVTGGTLLVLRHYRDLRTVADYVRRLSEGDGPVPTPEKGSTVAQEVMATIARLQRQWRHRHERLTARLESDESILEALHDPLILVDSQRQVLRVNRAARNLFGEKISGRDLAAVLRNPDVLGAVEAVLGGAASRAVEFSLPVPVERVFETRVKLLRRAVPVPPVAGDLDDGEGDGGTAASAAMLTFHDITSIKRSEQTRADFIANASHELRTPLSSLLGFIETLRGPARDDAEAHERFLSIMHDQASRMSRLVHDLMSLSRIEQDEHMPPTGHVDMVEVLNAAIAAFELKARARKIRIRLEALDDLPPVVGDSDQIAQVIQNLVSNAIKYTREDTEVTVSMTLTDGASVGGGAVALRPAGRRGGRAAGQMIAIAVTDRGDGIDRTHLPRLTERFYRVDAARSRAMGGTGLGLAIVKHILNRHRGRLTIESETGKGSTFTAYLPVAADGGQGNRSTDGDPTDTGEAGRGGGDRPARGTAA